MMTNKDLIRQLIEKYGVAGTISIVKESCDGAGLDSLSADKAEDCMAKVLDDRLSPEDAAGIEQKWIDEADLTEDDIGNRVWDILHEENIEYSGYEDEVNLGIEFQRGSAQEKKFLAAMDKYGIGYEELDDEESFSGRGYACYANFCF